MLKFKVDVRIWSGQQEEDMVASGVPELKWRPQDFWEIPSNCLGFWCSIFFQIVWVFGLQILGREPSLGIPLVRTLVHSSFRYPFYQNICKNGLVMEISFKFGNIIFFGKKSFEAENSNRKKYVLSISRWWFHGAHSYEKHFLLSQTIF